jgi:hypothetical protein
MYIICLAKNENSFSLERKERRKVRLHSQELEPKYG